MFSRYKKPNAQPTSRAPAPEPVPEAAAEASPASKPVMIRKPMPKAAAQAPSADKDRKRKERLSEIKLELHRALLDNLNLSALETASEAELRGEIGAISTEILEEKGIVLNREDRTTLNQELYDEVTGLGPLEALLKDESVNDILVNGPQRIFVERAGKLELSDITFKDEKHLLRIIDKIVSAVGRRVDESNPYVDARLADGSRFNAMVPPVAVDGSLVSIRKFKKDKLGIDDLVSFGAFSEEMAAYLQAAVATRLNVIVSGGTGSGKTTLLNVLGSRMPKKQRLLVVEDASELQIKTEHIVNFETNPIKRPLPPLVAGNKKSAVINEVRSILTQAAPFTIQTKEVTCLRNVGKVLGVCQLGSGDDLNFCVTLPVLQDHVTHCIETTSTA